MHRVNRMVLVATLAVFVVTQTFCLVAASYAEGGSVSGLHVQAAMQAMQSLKSPFPMSIGQMFQTTKPLR